MKRSCRRRLYHHNARRRNPRQQFNSTRPSSSFYDERQQMNTVVNKGQLVLSKTAVNSSWDSYSSKYTISDESTLEPEKSNSIVSYVPSATTAGVSHAWSWPFSSDGTTAEFFNQGLLSLFFGVKTAFLTYNDTSPFICKYIIDVLKAYSFTFDSVLDYFSS
ncbi:unnamed protein product [Cuscuta epithymum]|uniref:SBP-type domain-containing protein n=1 Tax=Cuscuta epithymum TaxID=186058 RepID=A0AAV0E4U5_9ASTE|nr:unnamed protein product [Cuscuta epithymum]CAH9129618.1 unnamed protein product [Cuscuta epithymum]